MRRIFAYTAIRTVLGRSTFLPKRFHLKRLSLHSVSISQEMGCRYAVTAIGCRRPSRTSIYRVRVMPAQVTCLCAIHIAQHSFILHVGRKLHASATTPPDPWAAPTLQPLTKPLRIPQRKDWISLVAVHSDAWLLSLSFYKGARLNREER